LCKIALDLVAYNTLQKNLKSINMKKTFLACFTLAFIFISCSDDNNSSPNNNNNGGGGGGNNSGCSGGPSTVTDIDGNTYNVVTIGNQCWMKENLKVSKYRNGDAIPTNLTNTQWETTTSGAYAVHDNDPANNAIYGKLYNWYAAADSRGLCPTGWHVPADSEWNIVVKALDPQADTSINSNLQSAIAGGLMKTTGTLQAGTGLWEDPNTSATNSSGFTGLPGADRYDNGSFYPIGYVGLWWSSTQFSADSAWYRDLYYGNAIVGRNPYNKGTGFSVRCVRD